MKEVVEEDSFALDRGMDECCSIAESMIEEIHQIALPECSIVHSVDERHMGSFRKLLLRQIRAARKVAMR
jgi:UDP-N-acetylmuramyl pentapeptide synthase